jgi:hypothetical protein
VTSPPSSANLELIAGESGPIGPMVSRVGVDLASVDLPMVLGAGVDLVGGDEHEADLGATLVQLSFFSGFFLDIFQLWGCR